MTICKTFYSQMLWIIIILFSSAGSVWVKALLRLPHMCSATLLYPLEKIVFRKGLENLVPDSWAPLKVIFSKHLRPWLTIVIAWIILLLLNMREKWQVIWSFPKNTASAKRARAQHATWKSESVWFILKMKAVRLNEKKGGLWYDILEYFGILFFSPKVYL